MDKVSVSVVVPVYNIPNGDLQRCANSLLAQSLKEIELIFVNDCSPNKDNIVYLRELERKYSNVTIIDLQKNEGVSNARNLGILHAKGDYLGFVDSDDYVDERMYERLYYEAVGNNADIVKCSIQEKKGDDIIAIHNQNPAVISIENIQDYINGIDCLTGAACNSILRSDLAKATLFNVKCKHYEDYLFIWHIILKSKVLVSIPDVLYNYCYRDDSVSRSEITIKKYKNLFDSFEQISIFIKTLVATPKTNSIGKYLFYFIGQLSIYNVVIASKIFENVEYLKILKVYLDVIAWFNDYEPYINRKIFDKYRNNPKRFVKSPLLKFGRLLSIYAMYSCYNKGWLFSTKKIILRLCLKK